MIAWIKSHAQWIAGGIIAILAAFYLLTHRGGGGGAAAPGVVSFPAAGGGGGGGLPPSPAPTTVSGSPSLPYSPDFGILAAIKDDALKALYENEYNLEIQINQATLAGNDSLLATLQGMLGDVQQQITNYKPAAPPPPNPTTTSGTTMTDEFYAAAQKAWADLVVKRGATWAHDYNNDLNFWQEELNPLGWTSDQVAAAFAAAGAYVRAVGQLPTAAQMNYWLQQAAAGKLKAPAPVPPPSLTREKATK